MSLHFLLKAEARSLSVVQVLAMSDEEALALVPPAALGRRGASGLPALRHGAPALLPPDPQDLALCGLPG
jgi:hypothetical protein